MTNGQPANPLAQSGKTVFRARALLLGDRIDLRRLPSAERLATDPFTITAGASGVAVLFRYGAAVLFNVSPDEEAELLRSWSGAVEQAYAAPETESLEIRIDPSAREGLGGSRDIVEGNPLVLFDYALERLQLVSDVLSKSTVLAFHETRVTRSFESIEPFAVSLQNDSASLRTARDLLRQIGAALVSEQDLLGRVEVGDKPEITWERPDLERLYLRLRDEFEILERDRMLERKLNLIGRTAETVLEIMQNRRNLRLEFYIAVLVLAETLLMIYELFFRH